MTKKMKCTCHHPFQDKEYGTGIRLFNETTKPAGWRCTVCGAKVAMQKEDKKKE